MATRAHTMRAEGHDVLSFSAGEPDFDTPEAIKDAAKAALDRGETKYAPVAGIPALREAVSTWVNGRYGIDSSPSQVLVSNGAKQVVFQAAAALLEAGDEALIVAPYWVSYPDMFSFCGAKTVVVPTTRERGFVVDPADLRAALTDRTRLVLLNSPNNPCGATYPREVLSEIATILREYPNAAILSDDIYSELVYDGEFTSIAHVAPDLLDRTLIIHGVSKTYSMTGWRLGYGVGPEELIKAMSRIQGASTSGACTFAQPGALQALIGPQDEALRMREVFMQRRDRMLAGLRSIEGLEVPTPGGAFYVFPDVSAFFSEKAKNSFELAEHLLDTELIATVPGGAFGIDDCIRLSFACGEDTIDEGVRRLRRGLESLH